jgi:hypothetical protein
MIASTCRQKPETSLAMRREAKSPLFARHQQWLQGHRPLQHGPGERNFRQKPAKNCDTAPNPATQSDPGAHSRWLYPVISKVDCARRISKKLCKKDFEKFQASAFLRHAITPSQKGLQSTLSIHVVGKDAAPRILIDYHGTT